MQRIEQLLKEADDYDKDKRFMAAADLCAALEHQQVDSSIERQICGVFVKQLDDTSIDVQGNAVKCIKKVCGRIHENQLQDIIQKLVNLVLNGQAEFRDIYATCLKGLITDVSENSAELLTKNIIKPILPGINSKDLDVADECVDILHDLCKRFGHFISVNHTEEERNQLLLSVLNHLNSEKVSLRKRSTQAIGSLSLALSQKQLHQLVTKLVSNLQKNQSNLQYAHTIIAAVGAISRAVGQRLGPFLNDIIPLLLPFCNSQGNIMEEDMEFIYELMEACLATFESFVRKCPRDVGTHVQSLLETVKVLLSFDPNQTSLGDQMDIEEEEGWEGYSDPEVNEDGSWKVRRAAIRVVDAIIKSRPEVLSQLYEEFVDVFIKRFNEREENVKLDVFDTFSALIRTAIVGDVDMESQDLSGLPSLARTRSSAVSLKQKVGNIIDGVLQQLSQKSARARGGITSFLLDMSFSMPDSLSDYLNELLPHILKNLNDRENANIRISTLIMLRKMLHGARPEQFAQAAPQLIPATVEAIQDSYFKTSSEGLRVAAAFAKVLRVLRINGNSLFEASIVRLSQTDIDAEVKTSALHSISIQLSFLNETFQQNKVSQSLHFIYERMKSDVTRIPALKALIKICSSENVIDFGTLLDSLLQELFTFLQKQSRALKLITLQTLLAFVKRYNNKINNNLKNQICKELAPFVSDVDLHLTLGALDILNEVTKFAYSPEILDNAYSLAQSPLLQQNAAVKLEELFVSLVQQKRVNSQKVYQQLWLNIENLQRPAFPGVAKCTAAVVVFEPGLVNDIIINLKSNSEAKKQISAFTLGELGRKQDLTSKKELITGLLALFDSGNEDTKTAASIAFGNLSVGNVGKIVPIILNEMNSSPQHQYLLLISLKEVISQQPTGLQQYSKQAMPLLIQHCENEEEGVRNVVSECLGRLCAHDNATVQAILPLMSASNPLVRQTVVSTIKYSAAINPNALLPMIQPLAASLSDPDINVRRAALVSLNAFVHNDTSQLKAMIPDLIRQVYVECQVRQELIKEVDLGPFKHKQDEGLPIRKSAYTTLETLLDHAAERLEINELTEQTVHGLQDPAEEVQTLCHQILAKLTLWAAGAVIAVIEQIIPTLQDTVTRNLKMMNAKQEIERAKEMIRSVVRLVNCIRKVPESSEIGKFQDFVNSLRQQKLLTEQSLE